MKTKIFIFVYTIISISFLIGLSIIKKATDIMFIGFLVYFFILFMQYKILYFKNKTFIHFMIKNLVMKYIVLILGIFYLLIVIFILINDIEKNIFGYFVYMGCVSSCFYTFFICNIIQLNNSIRDAKS